MRGAQHTFGDLLKSWREARGLSQLALSADAGVTQKHLSFIETGRAAPSRAMVLLLAEHLDIPLRDRNTLLLAAGFAPAFQEKRFDDASLTEARKAVEMVVYSHEPYPALAFDRHWNIIIANAAVKRLLDGVDAALLTPPTNVVRLSLAPGGLAPRIINLRQWREHLLDRLRRQYRVTRDVAISALLGQFDSRDGLSAGSSAASPETGTASVLIPLRLATAQGVLSFFSTTTVFGTPTEVTLSELTLEVFHPADAHTAATLNQPAPGGA